MNSELASYLGKALTPIDRLEISTILNEGSTKPIFAICLFEYLCEYIADSWSCFKKIQDCQSIPNVLYWGIQSLIDSKKILELRILLRTAGSDLTDLIPNFPTSECPMPIWYFPTALLEVSRAIANPKYWENKSMCLSIEDTSPDEYDAATILCIMYLAKERSVLCTNAASASMEFYSLDPTKAENDVISYWSKQLIRLDQLLQLSEMEVDRILASLIDQVKASFK